MAGELADQRLDRVAQALAALDVSGALGQMREQVPQTSGSAGPELLVRADAQQLLGDGECDDLGIGQHPPSVLGLHRQEIVSGAQHRYEQQVEVGVHRGPRVGAGY
ncbi:MAG TPA: hypothetical protein VES62_00730 [Thermoleophilaceae bacterium]|nr:hypothetical protein [Thermoleophilaceae bacterium]